MIITGKLYQEILEHCKMLYYSKRLHVFSLLNYFDLAHTVICDSDFSTINYKKIAKVYIMAILTEHKKNKIVSLEAIGQKDVDVKITCCACGFSYEERHFSQSTSICNGCYRKKNKDRINENHQRYLKKNPGKYKEYNAIYAKKYNEENRERLKIYKANWYKKNKEKQNTIQK